MIKRFYKQLGSTLAHLQDLFDTVFQGLLISADKKRKNTVMANIKDGGDAYYETYSDIKKGKE